MRAAAFFFLSVSFIDLNQVSTCQYSLLSDEVTDLLQHSRLLAFASVGATTVAGCFLFCHGMMAGLVEVSFLATPTICAISTNLLSCLDLIAFLSCRANPFARLSVFLCSSSGFGVIALLALLVWSTNAMFLSFLNGLQPSCSLKTSCLVAFRFGSGHFESSERMLSGTLEPIASSSEQLTGAAVSVIAV